MKSHNLPLTLTPKNDEIGRSARRNQVNSIKLDMTAPASENSIGRKTATRTVTFVDASSNEIIPYFNRHDEYQPIKWMSRSDRLRVRHELKRDVEQARCLLSMPNDQVTSDDLYKFVGLENILSLSLVKRTISDRKSHVQNVLSEQFRQDLLSIHGEEAIRRVSERMSQASKDRAHTLALEYSKMEDF